MSPAPLTAALSPARMSVSDESADPFVMTDEELKSIAKLAVLIACEEKRKADAEADFIKKMGYKQGGIAVEIPIDKRPPCLITSYPFVSPREDLISITVKGNVELPEKK